MPTRTPRRLTVRQKILAVAVTLPTGGFAFGRLVVMAWERFPESFALEGEPHPDSNKVLAKLCGADGVCGLGWLERTEQKTYRVTDKGQREATRVSAIVVPERPAKPRRLHRATRPKKAPALDEHDFKALAGLAKSVAYQKFLRGGALELADANRFWHPRDVAGVTSLLERVIARFADDATPDPRLPPVSTCYGLLNLHRMMATKFGAR